jgi:hypothetical protein
LVHFEIGGGVMEVLVPMWDSESRNVKLVPAEEDVADAFGGAVHEAPRCNPLDADPLWCLNGR